MVNKLERLSQVAVTELLTKLETKLDADVFTYYGEIVNGVERNVKDIIEALAKDPNKHQAIYVFLTTPGGSLTPVQRMVDILRHFYRLIQEGKLIPRKNNVQDIYTVYSLNSNINM